MILYVDTAALLKLYLEESESPRVCRAVGEAMAVCTHLIAYAEMRAGLAHAVKMRRVSAAGARYQRRRFEADWSAMQIVLVDEPLVRRAGDLAEHCELRGCDSAHLAAAERIGRTVTAPAAAEFHFVCFNQLLRQAAKNMGLNSLD